MTVTDNIFVFDLMDEVWLNAATKLELPRGSKLTKLSCAKHPGDTLERSEPVWRIYKKVRNAWGVQLHQEMDRFATSAEHRAKFDSWFERHKECVQCPRNATR